VRQMFCVAVRIGVAVCVQGGGTGRVGCTSPGVRMIGGVAEGPGGTCALEAGTRVCDSWSGARVGGFTVIPSPLPPPLSPDARYVDWGGVPCAHVQVALVVVGKVWTWSCSHTSVGGNLRVDPFSVLQPMLDVAGGAGEEEGVLVALLPSRSQASKRISHLSSSTGTGVGTLRRLSDPTPQRGRGVTPEGCMRAPTHHHHHPIPPPKGPSMPGRWWCASCRR
jgi:hypothetical protein